MSNNQNLKILIVGGGSIGAGINSFLKQFQDSIISFDVYNSEHVDFIADAHSIPIKNEIIDVIIIQAVLEHVLNPSIVISECHRVLSSNGIIYAETPFLQHVHEAAYDFTRYTPLGHRIAFLNFSEISSGYIGGLGQSMLWSIEYFFAGIFRSRNLGKIIKLSFFWLRWLELLIPDKWNIDGACGSFYIGRKSTINNNKEDFINKIKKYNGAQK